MKASALRDAGLSDIFARTTARKYFRPLASTSTRRAISFRLSHSIESDHGVQCMYTRDNSCKRRTTFNKHKNVQAEPT